MGTYTTNFKMFKAADVDSVDVTASVSNNMNLIDQLLYEECQLEVNSSSFGSQAVPDYQNKHVYSLSDGGIRVWDNFATNGVGSVNNWQPTHASPNEWTAMSSLLINSWKDVAGFSSYYRFSKEDTDSGDNYLHVELRGRISLGAFLPITQNTLYTISNDIPGVFFPTVPAGGFGPAAGPAVMGNSPASTTAWNRAFILPQFDFANNGMALGLVRKCGVNGVNTQTSGNSENYVCLDGVRIPVARFITG